MSIRHNPVSSNLWPKFPKETISTPVTILKEQAGYLQQSSEGILKGEVVSFDTDDLEYPLGATFRIVAPFLNGYRFTLLHIKHPLQVYPLKVEIDGSFTKIGNQEVLIGYLTHVFQSEKTQNIIKLLMSQSLEFKDNNETDEEN